CPITVTDGRLCRKRVSPRRRHAREHPPRRTLTPRAEGLHWVERPDTPSPPVGDGRAGDGRPRFAGNAGVPIAIANSSGALCVPAGEMPAVRIARTAYDVQQL